MPSRTQLAQALVIPSIAIVLLIITIMTIHFKKKVYRCKWAVHGCQRQDRHRALPSHQERCAYRVIHCPAKIRGSCSWTGSAAKLLIHGRQKPCIQVVTSTNENEPFKSWIGNFRQANRSVFNQAATIHWNPILFVSPAVANYLVYIHVQRRPDGVWLISPRSYSPFTILRRLTIKIEVFRPGATQPHHVYEGGLVSNHLSKEQALAAGNLMVLSDGQLERFQTEECIFQYQVTISTGPPGPPVQQ